MRRKITLYLLILFAVFLCGGIITAVHIVSTNSLFNKMYKFYRIENLRHSLVQRVLRVQADLTALDPTDVGVDGIIENVASLDSIAAQCFSCHHNPLTTAELEKLKKDVSAYKDILSLYITASVGTGRIDELKKSAAIAGNLVLDDTEKLAFRASKNMQHSMEAAGATMARAKLLLPLIFLSSCLISILIGRRLTKSITGPVAALVAATGKITTGELGYTLDSRYDTEFDTLARNFNALSRSLQSGYEKLETEIGERREAETALRRSEERYALAARGANDGLWEWDITNHVCYFSPRWKEMLGFKDDEFGTRPKDWLRMVHQDDRGRLVAKIKAHLKGYTTHLRDEHRVQHADGSYRWMLVRGLAEGSRGAGAVRMAGSQTDITTRKVAEEQLMHNAFHDALTGLPNRALFLDRLEHLLGTVKRHPDYTFAVLFIDLDRFKFVNDSLGHLAGDELLVEVAKRLLGSVRPDDTVARLGGDEFALLLEDVRDREGALKVARRINKELPLPLHVAGHEVVVTASIGVALSSDYYTRPDELLRDADLAMYHAKENGKARFEVFESAMYTDTMRHLQMETELRKAIDRNEFHLVYQPIICLKTGELEALEALIRWNHPTFGEVSPSEFIPLAEETGLISFIGMWVIAEACHQMSYWQQNWQAPFPSVTVNISGPEFSPDLVHHIKEILGDTGVDPGKLQLEITERTIMLSPETNSHLLNELKDLGVGLHIDDFGTGYSSLSYLHQFPIDTLKIDRSFIQRVNEEAEHLEIVKTIIALAGNLNMRIVAEGVETLEQHEVMTALGCEMVQGFHYYHPLMPHQVETLFSNRREHEHHTDGGLSHETHHPGSCPDSCTADLPAKSCVGRGPQDPPDRPDAGVEHIQAE